MEGAPWDSVDGQLRSRCGDRPERCGGAQTPEDCGGSKL